MTSIFRLVVFPSREIAEAFVDAVIDPNNRGTKFSDEFFCDGQLMRLKEVIEKIVRILKNYIQK